MEFCNFVGRLTEYGMLVLHAPDVDDEFHAAVRQLLGAYPISAHLIAPMDRFITIAHQSMPSSDRSTAFHWRTLYIDASIVKALACASMPDLHLHEHLVRECIATLDHAIVIAGAADDPARRDYVVRDIMKQLQSIIPSRSPSSTIFLANPPPPDPHPLSTCRNGVHTLATLPSIITAQRHCRAPFVVRGYANDWPAMHPPHQWASLAYLFSVAGPGRIVPVEVGDDYRADDWSQTLISWEEFLSSLDPSLVSVHRHRHTLYLAQHNLLTQFPQLRQDIILPDLVYACLDTPDFPAYEPPPDVVLNAWLGPKGTISPAHTDPFFNCYGEHAVLLKDVPQLDFPRLVQVVGRKTVWLAPPHVAPAMYLSQPPQLGADRSNIPAANTTSPSPSNTSRVDVFPHEMDTSQATFPLFWDTVPDEASCVTLSAGDVLFFPPGWWHAMRSEDVSFSVSMWF